MLRTSKLWLLILTISVGQSFAAASADWKGKGYDKLFQVSALTGMTVMGTTVGYTIQPAIAALILDKGLISGVNNQVYGEMMMGPTFTGVGTGFQVSAHMRWDFHKDDYWSFYGLGGLGWDMIPQGTNTTLNGIHARFAIGSFWHLFPEVSIRAELSHELIAAGATFMF